MQHETPARTITVALVLSLVCSIIVSGTAVALRARQEENRLREKQKNVLVAAGILDEARPIAEQFQARIEPKVIDLEEGWYSDASDPATFDPVAAAADPALSDPIDPAEDIAGIKRRERRTLVYEVRSREGDALEQLVLPIRGYGLWSTLRGFLAVDARSLGGGPQAIEVTGITYYDQKETPGLGGEVDNPRWKALWIGKHIYDDDWTVRLHLTRGATGPYEVDALSGATLTSQGVSNMIRYWMGPRGFQPFLKNLSARLREGGDHG